MKAPILHEPHSLKQRHLLALDPPTVAAVVLLTVAALPPE